MADERDPEEAYELPIATNTPDDVRSGADASAYNPPAEDDPGEDHEPTEEPS